MHPMPAFAALYGTGVHIIRRLYRALLTEHGMEAIITAGMNENLVGITQLAYFCKSGTQQKVDEAKKDIISGKLGIFDGVIETNTGTTVGENGKTLKDSDITGNINWYFKTVTVVQ